MSNSSGYKDPVPTGGRLDRFTQERKVSPRRSDDIFTGGSSNFAGGNHHRPMAYSEEVFDPTFSGKPTKGNTLSDFSHGLPDADVGGVDDGR